jgi:hypothetical protein
MGAFAGILSAMSGLAANSRSQGQRQAQEDMIAQLKAQGLMEQNASGAMSLQDQMQQRTAVQKLLNDPNTPAEVKQAIALGMSPADAMKMKSQGAAGALFPKLLTAKPEARAQILADAITADPTLPESPLFPQLQKLAGVGEKPGRPFAYVDKNTGAPILYSPESGPIPPNAVPEQVYASQHKEPKAPRETVLTDGKGNAVIVNLDTGARRPLPDLFKTAPKAVKGAGERKPLTPAAMNAIDKQIQNEWDLQPMAAGDFISGDRKRQFYTQRKTAILLGMGYDKFGQPLKPGTTIKLPNGDTATWNP